MRIIGGEFRSRRLVTPRDASTTRPIPDRVKESIFGLLRGHTENAAIFDGFAGTGAIGLEAISRGASRCVFIERDRKIAEILRQNIQNLGVEDRCEMIIGDALGPGALARCPRPANLVFLDPPYPLVGTELGWKRVRMQLERLIDLLADDGFAMLRTPWPFTIEVAGEEPQPAAPAPTSRRSPAPRRDRRPREQPRWRDEAPPLGRRRPEPAPAHVDHEEPEGGDEAAAAGSIRIPADLTLPNADGPETHIYHAMAVHFYARRKQQVPAADGDRH